MQNSQNLASRLSALYDGPEIKPTWNEINTLIDWVIDQRQRIPCPVIYTDFELTLDQCIDWHRRYGVLLISTAHNASVILTSELNLKFRAVHDWHHIVAGADSTLSGEIKVFKFHRACAPKSIHWLLFSEIVLQSAACIHNGKFQPQKLVRVGGF